MTKNLSNEAFAIRMRRNRGARGLPRIYLPTKSPGRDIHQERADREGITRAEAKLRNFGCGMGSMLP